MVPTKRPGLRIDQECRVDNAKRTGLRDQACFCIQCSGFEGMLEGMSYSLASGPFYCLIRTPL